MLHVAEKMLGFRARARLRYRHGRHDDAAAELRQQLDHRDAGSHSHADNSDRDADLRSGSLQWSRMHAGHNSRNSAKYTNGVFCPG
jgi:hypothetical protein